MEINERVVINRFKWILKKNAPMRDFDSVPREIRSHGKVISPYPGNLRLNGIYDVPGASGYKVTVGGEPAVYAIKANERSRRKGYIEKSEEEFLLFLQSVGGIIK